MTLMEKIVRPYVPVDTGPTKEAPQCRDVVGSTTLRYKAPAGLSGGGGKTSNLMQPTNHGTTTSPSQQEQKPSEKSNNSSWSYAYKKYMTKVEKEEDKCAEDDEGSGIVGGQSTSVATK